MTLHSRRKFVRNALSTLGALSVGSSAFTRRMVAATTQVTGAYQSLVCIDLDGGNDGNNVIVPMSSEQYGLYASARQALALNRSSLLTIGDGNGGAYGLHPSLANIRSRYLAGNAAIVANVGTLVVPDDRVSFLQQRKEQPVMLEDHEVQRAEWGTAYSTLSPSSGNHSGWGGRIADALTGTTTLGYPVVTSLIGTDPFAVGDFTSPATISSKGVIGFPADISTQDLQQISLLSSGSALVSSAAKTLHDSIGQTKLLNAALSGVLPFKTVFPTTDIGSQLREVATVMTARSALGMNRQIFLCKMSGFDHHEMQLVSQTPLLLQLDQAVGAFMNFLDEMDLAQQVTVFTQSDFGRSLAMNSSAGSDHAWGNHLVVLGGALKGNKLYGKFPSLELGGPDDLSQTGGWIPTTSVEQYGTPLASWFGVSKASMTKVFPNLPAFEQNTIRLFG